ncbi:right-handed parallel beta-helix repeat-containing protein [Acinetobacter pollinis]|uniref:Right-handed parallel beta-helix repeat-containing protein n=1 Tax=Acinetobacter pollinis TaxID=2605270 RepID=A0ABU6DPC4_9GAMM|nr:right-handed parallel beta-helix repeat-containing protein [Acinetobacter pollinis]MEB5475704.1 right-handed parallel beta-helix repeat-containing protein [Acinetobacter pollinis]
MKSKSLSLFILSLATSCLTMAETYHVNRYEDDGEKGSLRWAIEQSNANTTQENQILIEAVGQSPYVIKINKPLPPIRSSLKIIGTQWEKTGEFITLDGSNYIPDEGAKACPGAVSGQYGTNVRTMTLPGLVLQDVNGITIKGLDIHRFCIGILVNRSSNNLIQHNRISNNYGGSGIMITGDDGKGNPTSTTTNNNKVIDNIFQDNGDGLELTRGAAFNLVANNLFTNSNANPEPSQGIEILWGNDNTIIGNKFENYSDGLQINWGKRNYVAYNEISQNSLGLNLTGDGNIFDSNRIHNNRIGVAIRSEKDINAHITLTKNQIWNNSKDIKRCEAGGSCIKNQRLGAIIFSVPALEHDGFVGSRGGGVVIEPNKLQKTCSQKNQENCNPIPNQNIQPPTLSFKNKEVTVQVKGMPNHRYKVEFFGSSRAYLHEAEQYLGSKIVVTNSEGLAKANWRPSVIMPSLTATVTDDLGATSELSQAVQTK